MARAPQQPRPPDDDDDEDVLDEASGDATPTEVGAVRVDKWLWAARMFKSRSAASDACDAGHVKINQSNTRPSKLVRPGDRVEARTEGGPRILVVKALADKRGPASVAVTLYEDHSPPPPPREPIARWDREGRPTKKDRREIDRFKRW